MRLNINIGIDIVSIYAIKISRQAIIGRLETPNSHNPVCTSEYLNKTISNIEIIKLPINILFLVKNINLLF